MRGEGEEIAIRHKKEREIKRRMKGGEKRKERKDRGEMKNRTKGDRKRR